MAIRSLGKETALLLRVSALVVTPLSLIKELVDNAIDAGATSVKVRMTRNGVSQIEVQDNGVGICPDDFEALGRRAHTSKLRALKDLPQVGGTSLGFRGEALAAANSFAEVTITTRTAQQKVGHRVNLESKRGGVKKHGLTPAPVGTTVRVQNLFANIPVRKKIITDNIQKSTVDIKHLFQAYALAKPQIRLSFGILDDNKPPWSYSPVATSTVRDAVFQVLGKDLAAQYTNITFAEPASSPNIQLVKELTEHEMPRIAVDAFLPKKDADLSKGCNKGTFISVDGRPMAPGRGTIGKVVAAFRARLESVYHYQGTQSNSSNVFIQLDIQCPPGSYDVNVSPAKDEVLFTDESRVLNVIGHLLETNYPVTEKVGSPDGSKDGGLHGLSPEDLQLLESITVEDEGSPGPVDSLQPLHDALRIDQKPVPDETRRPTYMPEVKEVAPNPTDQKVIPGTSWLIDMSNPCDDDDVPRPTAAPASVIDQLRSPVTQRVQRDTNRTDIKEDGDADRRLVLAMTGEPWQDSCWPPPANTSNPWTIAVESGKERQACRDSGSFATNSAFGIEREEANSVFLTELRLGHPGTVFPFSPSSDLPPGGVGMCTPPRTLLPPAAGALQSPPSSDGRNPRQGNILPQFKPPTMSAPRGRQPQASRPRSRPQQCHQQVGSSSHGAVVPPYDKHQVENSLSLDSYMVPLDSRALCPSPDPSFPDPFLSPPFLTVSNAPAGELPGTGGLSPLDNMELNDAGALGDWGHVTVDAAAADEDERPSPHCPQKCLVRLRSSMTRDMVAGRVLRRMRSALLPLETTPVEQEMQTVAQKISTSHTDLRSAVLFLVDIDSYISTGACQAGLPDDLEGAMDIEARLKSVYGEWAQRTAGVGRDLELNLRGLMKGKSCG